MQLMRNRELYCTRRCQLIFMPSTETAMKFEWLKVFDGLKILNVFLDSKAVNHHSHSCVNKDGLDT